MSGVRERKSPELTAQRAVTSRNIATRERDTRTTKKTGRLILIVGPSGAGKDTLLLEARQHFSGIENVVFCERIITRTGDIGEKHISVSTTEFEHMAASGGFFLFWDAHGLRYGLPAEMRKKLEAGKTVIANVSRRIIDEARGKWLDTLVVNITANRNVLRERLLARGRESTEAIEKRLDRVIACDFPNDASIEEIDNSGMLQPAAEQLIRIIAASMKINRP